MATSSTTTNVRILPNNKVYRQLFEAQVILSLEQLFIHLIKLFKVQLSDAYNRVRDTQLLEPTKITTHPDATPLVKNIRPHGNKCPYS